MTKRREIASHEYKNGAFGYQTARLYREGSAWVFYNGWADGAWYGRATEGKKAFRDFVAEHA